MAVVGTSLVAARFLLAAVFLVAGAAKLADRPGSRNALAGFGVPGPLTGPLGVAVPIAELSVALSLLGTPTARWGAVGALALLAVFAVGIANALARGREPDCHCFGRLHSEPVSASTLARNAVLALIAGFVVLGHPLRAPTVAELAVFGGAALLAAAGLFGWHLLRQYGRVLMRLDALERLLEGQAPIDPLTQDDLPVGSPAPPLAAADLRGTPVGLEQLLAPGRAVMLVFTDPSCGPCNALLPDVAQWQLEHQAQLTVAVLSHGSADDNRAAAAEHGIERVLLAGELDPLYSRVAGVTPSALLISRDGDVAAPVARGPAAIRALVGDALASTDPIAHSIGDPAPQLGLSDLSGAPVVLPVVEGRDTLLLFWNPACGHCEHMLGELRALELEQPPEAPSLLLVSAGDAETNRAQGLASAIALDPDGTARRAFGIRGTPMAVVVDSDGRFASGVASGGPAVLALLTPKGSLNGSRGS